MTKVVLEEVKPRSLAVDGGKPAGKAEERKKVARMGSPPGQRPREVPENVGNALPEGDPRVGEVPNVVQILRHEPAHAQALLDRQIGVRIRVLDPVEPLLLDRRHQPAIANQAGS